MVTKGAGKSATRKLNFKKETIKNLDAKKKAVNVKGGQPTPRTQNVTCICFSLHIC